ncbi:GNAT family N-acetyltransferase [Kribbella sp. NPDC051718]|uniref:GNAT family N-acetyltransferase n=1 Tax=Kribbella sp. NPDC051718 TaxID=3155168 RepID=UPI003412BBD3
MITVREVDPHDEAAFDAWYDVLRAGAVADREVPLVFSREATASSMRHPNKLKSRHPVAAYDGERIVGAMLFEYLLTTNLDSVAVEIDVPPAERRRGVGTALWGWARARAAELGRTVYQAELAIPDGFTTETWPGCLFVAGLGFVLEHVEDHLVRPLPYQPQFELEPLEGYELISWTGACPEELLPLYAELRTAMSADVPTGGMTREPKVWTVQELREQEERILRSYLPLLVLARTLDGRPAGYTMLYLPLTDPDNALQEDTLVLRDHRGHNLGAHLKAANFEQLAKHQTTHQWLHTWTAETNIAMQKVNARFGFVPREKNAEYEVELPAPSLRPAARAVVLDPEDRILLLRFEFADGHAVWAPPGGGVEAGESLPQALARELAEEIGIEPPADAPHLWHQVTVADGHAQGFDGVTNDYFLVRTEAFTPAGSMSVEEMLAENVHGHRWWTFVEIQNHQGPEYLSPRTLPLLLARLRDDGPPVTPVFIGL